MAWHEHQLVQFTVFGFAMMAFFIAIKFLLNLLPDDGIIGDVKKTGMTA